MRLLRPQRSSSSWRARRHQIDVPINDQLLDQGRQQSGWLSVNQYGAVCLNSNNVLFGDIDCLPDPRLRRPKQLLLSFDEAHERIDTVAISDQLCFRVYRTCAGLRVIETTRLHEPTDETTLDLLRRLGCDQAFVLLTKKGSNFRARLTPKPWRASARTVNFHWLDNDVKEYLKNSPPWAVAKYLRSAGEVPYKLLPEIEKIVSRHDEFCLVNSELPLA